MSRALAAIIGVSAGGLALLMVIVGFMWSYLLQRKAMRNKSSETGSSDPSTFVGSNGGGWLSYAGCGTPSGQKGARNFTLEELEHATKNFSDNNLVGEGSFGLVYKGLLVDGTVAAIKRRQGASRHEFVEEVKCLSGLWHRNLVTLIGYCQENGQQMLVYEYLPNGSISSHLYDTKQNSTTKLEFKQRLSVAIGAAKGLHYLHNLTPPIAHNGFKTSNVLVDENFIAKVADAGVVHLLQRIEGISSSQAASGHTFPDPEFGKPITLSGTSDVYNFGLFLLELMTGQEAACHAFTLSDQTVAQWVESHLSANDLIDPRLSPTFTSEGMKGFIELSLQCMTSSGSDQPKMETVVAELDRILEKEIALTTVMGDGTAIVTLGSQLFSP